MCSNIGAGIVSTSSSTASVEPAAGAQHHAGAARAELGDERGHDVLDAP
jgi:hypothetical protein